MIEADIRHLDQRSFRIAKIFSSVCVCVARKKLTKDKNHWRLWSLISTQMLKCTFHLYFKIFPLFFNSISDYSQVKAEVQGKGPFRSDKKNMLNYGNSMMHMDQFRKMDTYSHSPKSSPRGGRSPIVSRQDSSGTLKTTISLGKNPSIVHSGPFYLMKEPPGMCAGGSYRQLSQE